MDKYLQIPQKVAELLCIAGNGDAALLYLWQAAGDPALPCPLGESQRKSAVETLSRLGLWQGEKTPILQKDEKPQYSENTLQKTLDDKDFSRLVGETQRLLGRVLSTEELKSLLSVYDYLRLPTEVACLLVSYCIQRSKLRSGRMPSLRAIEKEAYAWADKGIDSVEAAVEYVQAASYRQSRVGQIASLLQIKNRRLTDGECQYIDRWLSWGFPQETIALAYEKTVMNTGDLKWPYMNSILARWQEKGLMTVEDVRQGDGARTAPQQKKKSVGNAERDALRRLMGEED
jgi:DnaD/phage-associated family protein